MDIVATAFTSSYTWLYFPLVASSVEKSAGTWFGNCLHGTWTCVQLDEVGSCTAIPPMAPHQGSLRTSEKPGWFISPDVQLHGIHEQHVDE